MFFADIDHDGDGDGDIQRGALALGDSPRQRGPGGVPAAGTVARQPECSTAVPLRGFSHAFHWMA